MAIGMRLGVCGLILLAGLGSAGHSADPPSTPPPASALAQRTALIQSELAAALPQLVDLYKDLHQNPELSLKEFRTAARMERELKPLGFEITPGIGKTGLVAVLRNGPGPTVMIRTDLDALPVTEKTGVPYASTVRTRDAAGNDVGVMHACGHDMHMTCWVGTARVLASHKDRWKGTLVLVGQPAEEIGMGARLMLEEGLFQRFPRPDYALALHCDSRLQAGHVSYTEGLALANVDSVDILVKGQGGHGSAPHTAVDPVVLAARIVLDLQTIVSRENNPVEPCVVTVGSIHGGTKHNIIPNEVRLQLTVRTTKDSVRKQTLDAIARIAKAAAIGARAPEPDISIRADEFTPALSNDPALTRRTVAVLREALGEASVAPRPIVLGGEDFSRFGRAGVPIFMYWLGTISAERMAAAERDHQPLPSMHSDLYWPDIEPSIRAGVLSMSHAAWNLFGS